MVTILFHAYQKYAIDLFIAIVKYMLTQLPKISKRIALAQFCDTP